MRECTTRKNVIACLSCLVAVLLTGAASAEAPVVHNTKPSLPPEALELQEEWRVGGEDGDLIFGMMVDSQVDADGNVYLLDSQLSQIEVISPEGEHLRTLSREGDGPGELRQAQDMVWLPDETLGVVRLFPGGVVKLGLDGLPRGNFELAGEGGFSVTFNADSGGGTIIAAAQSTSQGENGTSQNRTQYLCSISETGEELQRFAEATMVLDFQNPVFVETDLLPPFLLASAVGPDGRIYVNRDRDAYRVDVFLPDGTHERVIERDFENWRRDARDRSRLDALIVAWTQGFPGEMEKEVDDYEPAITELFVDREGVLWVQHSRSGRDQPEGVLLTFDTFAPDGTWLREVSFRCEGDAAYDGLRFLEDGRVLLIKGYVLARWASRGAQNATFGEDEQGGQMEVICCRRP